MTRAWTRSCAACSVRKGQIFLMLCSANLQDRAVCILYIWLVYNNFLPNTIILSFWYDTWTFTIWQHWILYTKMKMYYVDEVVPSSEQIWRNNNSIMEWILCSEWVASEWESKQMINNPHNSNPSINTLWSEKLWVWNKFIMKMKIPAEIWVLFL